MNTSVCIVFVGFLFSTQVGAAVQKITIYQRTGQQGDSVTFTNKSPDLSAWRFFLQNTESYCVTGLWYFWDLPNFEFNSETFVGHSRTQSCGNRSFANFNSGRFLGAEDFSTPALSLLEGSGRFIQAGREYLVTGPAGNNLQFAPVSAFSFGNSSWTLFTGKDFDGKSICLAPNQAANSVDTGAIAFSDLDFDFVVQSVVRGCDTLQVKNNIGLFKNN